MSGAGESRVDGFSLIELFIAMVITLAIGLIVFQMFVENERTFRDQSLILEMQQNTRAVASMIMEEIRLAGQGVPVYATTHEATISEATQTFLSGTDADNIRFRAGLRNGRAVVTDSLPLEYTIGTSTIVNVDAAQHIAAIVGNTTGRHIYLWGPGRNGWTWVRAEIVDIFVGTNSLELTPRQLSGEGGSFRATPIVSLEEAVSYHLSAGSIRRGTTTTFTSLTAPTFRQSAVGDNFDRLRFSYYDGAGSPVDPMTPALRSVIRRVDFVLEATTAETLSTGSVGTYGISMSVSPRNLEIH